MIYQFFYLNFQLMCIKNKIGNTYFIFDTHKVMSLELSCFMYKIAIL